MKRLILVKGRSYSTKRYTAWKGIPFEMEEEAADLLLKTGRFQEIPVEMKGEADDAVKEDGLPRNFFDMTKSELESFAVANDIDLRGCKTKGEILAKLEVYADNVPEAELDFGSPMMEELQE